VRGAISREWLRDAIPFSADPTTLWKIEQTRTPVCVCFREFGISAWRFYGVLIVSRVYRTIKSNAQRSDRKTRILIRDYCGSANSLLHSRYSRFDKGATLGYADSIDSIDINRRQLLWKIRYNFNKIFWFIFASYLISN